VPDQRFVKDQVR